MVASYRGASGADSIWDTTICDNPGDKAYKFYQYTIKEVIISEGIEKIESHVFDYSMVLEKIKIPSTVISIGDYAFSRCSSLTSINIPDSVTSIGRGAFYNCSSLITINLEATTIPETWDSDWKGNCTATVNTGIKMD